MTGVAGASTGSPRRVGLHEEAGGKSGTFKRNPSQPSGAVISIGSLRTWLFLWLISLTGLLWATFILAQGVWFWVSAWLILAIVGSNILVMIMRLS